MTALSDALTAAQAKAIVTIERAYVAGHLDAESFAARLDEIGCGDVFERAHLLACLDTLREYGQPATTEREAYSERRKREPLTDPQRARIIRDCDAHSLPYPDFDALTKAQASEVIQSLEQGTYDPDKWTVPF
jgi:hypothetical protein